MSTTIIPIYYHSTEEVPVGNCPHSVKMSPGHWACLSETQYQAMQVQEKKREDYEKAKFQEYHFDIVLLSILSIAFMGWIYACVKLDTEYLWQEWTERIIIYFMYLLIALGFSIIAFLPFIIYLACI